VKIDANLFVTWKKIRQPFAVEVQNGNAKILPERERLRESTDYSSKVEVASLPVSALAKNLYEVNYHSVLLCSEPGGISSNLR